MKDELESAAREFINEEVKTLPLPVRLNGITEAEKEQAASICVRFARQQLEAQKSQVIEEFIAKVEEKVGLEFVPRGSIFKLMREVAKEMTAPEVCE